MSINVAVKLSSGVQQYLQHCLGLQCKHTPYRATMTLENVLLEPTLDTVKGILILDNDGKRILAKWVVTRAHNLCHDNRQLIVIAINRNHSASKINCN